MAAHTTLLDVTIVINININILFVFFTLLFYTALEAFFNGHAFVFEFILCISKLMFFSLDSLMAIRAYL
ncbi:hypothetical protein C2E16_16575 [Mixta calida]|uniref:Uncharacterized protein n=1 Tax=Mixta calida TaxID=665913 RepID=A0ABN5HDW3_9GAMM|nr:hypothetical protein C2E16_16575 [Mixta calida]ORM60742.1 hypothetical protein HA40_06905 [Mixta calida]